MTKRYELSSPHKNGEKTFWTNNIGVMWPAKEGDGFTIKLRCVPAPDGSGEITIVARPPQEKDTASPRKSPGRAEESDEIPF